MKHKLFVSLSLALIMAMLVTSLALADGTPTITSDLPDYGPGDTVNLFGAGWQASEGVHIFVNDDVGQSWSYNADVMAADNGTFTMSFQLPSWFVATYTVKATGAISGTATTMFTDGALQFVETGLPTGTSWSVTWNGITQSSTTNTISFGGQAATANYTVGSVTGYTASPSSGSASRPQNGNTQANITFTLSDTTPPTTTIALNPSTPNGNNGWYTADVHVTVSSVDVDVAETRCALDPVSVPATFDDLAGCAYTGLGADVTTDGTHTVYAASKDTTGNKEAIKSASFNIDKTAPTVAVTGVSNGAQYTLGSVPAAGCSTTDALSGVATAATLSMSGGPVGSVTATCSGALDNAGNPGSASVTYSVIYNWTGFFQPIDTNMLNIAKAGSGIPVKFSLSGNQGLNIFADGYPLSVNISCDGTLPTDSIETYTTGNSSLSYDALADQYVYVWKTDKTWAGSCRQLQVKLNDGTLHTANFKFK